MLKYSILVGILFYLIKNGLNIRLLTKLTIFKNNIFSLNKSIDFQIKLNLESSYLDSNDLKLNISKNLLLDDLSFLVDKSNRSLCKYVPDNLIGRLNVENKDLSEEQLEFKYSNQFPVRDGGHWKPKSCQPRYKVAIIVPYRDRDLHLRLFLNYMHPFLQKQQIDYRIYIIEEVPSVKFNRALLMNIGYREAIKDYDWTCLIFHDVDLVPEDDRNLYYCPLYPRHMSIAVNTLEYKLPYKEIFGGVSAIQRKHFELINGYSNLYFGWGAEDDDFAERILANGLKIIRYPENIGHYHMLGHDKDSPSKQRFKLLKSGKDRFKTDGLNSLKYDVLKKEYRYLYTRILVSFEEIEIT